MLGCWLLLPCSQPEGEDSKQSCCAWRLMGSRLASREAGKLELEWDYCGKHDLRLPSWHCIMCVTDKFSFRRRNKIPFLSSLAVRIKTYLDTCDGTVVVPPQYVFRIRIKTYFYSRVAILIREMAYH